jgi:hypothetical protein
MFAVLESQENHPSDNFTLSTVPTAIQPMVLGGTLGECSTETQHAAQHSSSDEPSSFACGRQACVIG